MRDNQLDTLAHARAREVRVVARGQWTGLVHAAEVVGSRAADGRCHGGRVGQRGHMAVAGVSIASAAGQGGQAGRTAVDSGLHWLTAVELGEVVPGIGG